VAEILNIGPDGAELGVRDEAQLVEVLVRHHVEVDIMAFDHKRLVFELLVAIGDNGASVRGIAPIQQEVRFPPMLPSKYRCTGNVSLGTGESGQQEQGANDQRNGGASRERSDELCQAGRPVYHLLEKVAALRGIARTK